ncbi:MAG: outer membrane protein transport protein, partial [Myxococcota bacterium]
MDDVGRVPSSHSPGRTAVWLVVVAGVSGWASGAGADETHYENFRFGQMALGLGGAVTGFLNEPEATYYNPGGLGFLQSSSFSGAINSFGIERQRIHGWISLDEPGRPETDGNSRESVALPTSSVLVKSFGKRRHALGYSTFLVSQTRDRFTAERTIQDEVFSERLSFELSGDDRILWTGPSYGYRLKDTLGLGVSLFYARRDNQMVEQASARLIDPDNPDSPSGYENVLEQFSANDGALLMRLGAMWKPNPRWSFGAMLSTPAVRLHGQGRYLFRFINTASAFEDEAELEDSFTEISARRKARTQYPWLIALGASTHVPKTWRLSAGLNIYMPYTYNRLEVSPEEDDDVSFVLRPRHELTINASLGSELYLAPRWPLRFGVFTNRASSPPITGDRLATTALPHVDLYGASISIGYQGPEAAINIGFEGQYGTGQTASLDASLEDDALPFLTRDVERYRVVFF